MLINDKKQLKKIETSIFGRAKTRTEAENDEYYKEYLANVVRLFFKDVIPYDNGRYDMDKNSQKILFDESTVYVKEKFEGKAAIEIIDNRDAYSDRFTITIKLDDDVSFIMNKESRMNIFRVYVNKIRGYPNNSCCDIRMDELSMFCEYVFYVRDNLSRWKEKAEKVTQTVLKDRMKEQMAETAVDSLITTKLDPLGMQYYYDNSAKSSTIVIKLSANETGTFYLKHDNIVENLDEIVALIKQLSGYLAKGNKLQVRFKSRYGTY